MNSLEHLRGLHPNKEDLEHIEAMLRNESAGQDTSDIVGNYFKPMGRGYIQIDPTPAGARTERNRRKRQNRKKRK